MVIATTQRGAPRRRLVIVEVVHPDVSMNDES